MSGREGSPSIMQEVVGGLRTDTDGDKDIGRCARLRLASRNEIGTWAAHCVLDDVGDEGSHDERNTKAEVGHLMLVDGCTGDEVPCDEDAKGNEECIDEVPLFIVQ